MYDIAPSFSFNRIFFVKLCMKVDSDDEIFFKIGKRSHSNFLFDQIVSFNIQQIRAGMDTRIDGIRNKMSSEIYSQPIKQLVLYRLLVQHL